MKKEKKFFQSMAGTRLTVRRNNRILLSAMVLDVKEEQIKVKFDVDKEQSIESAYWYPWEPDMGNLLYCMPAKGE